MYINFNVLNELLPSAILSELKYKKLYDKAEEIRIKAGSKIRVSYRGITEEFSKAKKEDVDYILTKAIRGSLYAHNDNIAKGYLSFSGGIRIGICGEAVYSGCMINTIKSINALVVRIPHNCYGVADEIIEKIVDGNRVKSTLLLAPPYSGKTTLLRELARQFSSFGKNVVIIDEKNEISATENGISYLDVGDSFVMVGIKRTDGIESAIRNLSPDVLVTDEIFNLEDRDSIERCTASGITVLTSMHSDEKSKDVEKLFECIVRLSNNPPGKIVEIKG